ncbi:MAG: PepSY-associated TM helix domain-containing protein, partial [Cyanobacteria bacterium P01_F01_bin.3]
MHSIEPNEQEAGRAQVRPASSQVQANVISRIIWRWHFWVGLLIGPVLLVASVTGAIYIFKDEILILLHPELLNRTVVGSHAPLSGQID